ncbi:MAG TPA: hypothetical protein VHU41_06190 [Thermoanaerobaculia bacterium]|jgi:hypothetical protein|nr:hypothetical protein [Thermoanaerobaculia bacterium]
MKKHIALLAAILVTSLSVGAQTILVSAETAHAETAFESACGGAWGSVLPSILSNKRMHVDDAHASQVGCLLKALAATTFNAHDAAADQRYVDVRIGLLVAAYDASADDFFASQLPTAPTRVQHGLVIALVDVGEPVATRMYFEMRRAEVQPVSDATLHYYRTMFAGRCLKAPCSPRLTESIGIVRSNLDIAETELRAVAAMTPREGASADELRYIDGVHRDALAMIERVQRMR